MTKRDITGRAAVKTAETMNRARHRLMEQIPMGPLQVRMSPRELRRLVERQPQMSSTIAQSMGAKSALATLMGVDSTPGPRNLTDYWEKTDLGPTTEPEID
jgi:hypothetical protein